jgi:hypothetical protein
MGCASINEPASPPKETAFPRIPTIGGLRGGLFGKKIGMVSYQLKDARMLLVPAGSYKPDGPEDPVMRRYGDVFTALGFQVVQVDEPIAETAGSAVAISPASSRYLDAVTILRVDLRKQGEPGDRGWSSAAASVAVYNMLGELLVKHDLETQVEESEDPAAATERALLRVVDEVFEREELEALAELNMAAMRLTLELPDQALMQQAADHLEFQAGIERVLPLSWDQEKKLGRLLVVMRADEKRRIGDYLSSVPGVSVAFEEDLEDASRFRFLDRLRDRP